MYTYRQKQVPIPCILFDFVTQERRANSASSGKRVEECSKHTLHSRLEWKVNHMCVPRGNVGRRERQKYTKKVMLTCPYFPLLG